MNAAGKRCLFLNLCLCFLICLLALLPAQASSPDTIPVTIKGEFDYQKAYDVLKRTNAIRKSKGLPALVMDKDLLNAAMQRAAEISLVFSHHRPDKTMCFSAAPGKIIGENIALGQKSAKEVVTVWKNSPDHYENMVNSLFGSVGIGCFEYNGTLYWAQVFGGNTCTKVSMPPNRTARVKVSLDRNFAEKYMYSSTSGGDSLYTGDSAEIKLYFYSTGRDYESFSPVRLLWDDFSVSGRKTDILSVSSSGTIRALKAGKGTLDIISKTVPDFRITSTLQIQDSSSRSVKLYANGGTFGVSSSEKIRKITVTYQQPYGKLPVPVRKGFLFKGWYTKGQGGTRITESKTVTFVKGKTQKLYARWSRVTPGNTAVYKISGIKSSLGLTLKWKKAASADGYEILLGTSKYFDNAETQKILLNGASKTSYTFKGLKNGKTYYVKVRAFSKDSCGRRVYGKYSFVKSKKLQFTTIK